MPLLMIGAFVVMTVASAIVIVVDPLRAAGALTPILLLQLFGASSGFDVPARRGHYDLLLTHGGPRRWIIVAHWLASALPGVVSWLTLAAICAIAGRGHVSLFSSGTLVAVGLVSTIPWATTVRLPRFAGAIGWLLIVATVSLVTPGILTLDGTPGERSSWAQTAWASLVYPPVLVGEHLIGTDALRVVPGLLFAAIALAVAFRSVDRRDIPLEAAQ
jgi:hypothetical protein